MKLVKKLVVATLLVSALSVSSFAGDLETPGYAPPPPDRSMYSVCTEETSESSTTTTSIETTDNTDLSGDLLFEALLAMITLL